jgi:1,4-alpha-glucan branching enzyme
MPDPFPAAVSDPMWISEFDLHLFHEGTHHRLYEKLGAHLLTLNGVSGIHFAVWAPQAKTVRVTGDFCDWAQDRFLMGCRAGVWQLFIPGLTIGSLYKYVIEDSSGHLQEKSDPFGFAQELRPHTASRVIDLDTYHWQDQDWITHRKTWDPLRSPISVYEVHLGSWMRPEIPSEEAPFLTYGELAERLIPYVKELGFTHLELMPLAEHPYDGSWGYQVTGYYAATSRYGSPQDLMAFVDRCHQAGLGVILDWVPGHFPRDSHGLARFDGTCLYEHPDPRRGEHPDWGTLVFNYGSLEVQNFLISNALFWVDKFHIDGLRVDAVASMLYLDYSRQEWLPNLYGGREHLEAIEFLRSLNTLLFHYYPGILSIAEESTAWPMVTWPVSVGGLGFNLKWNMGWMHDTLNYFKLDPWFRQFNHHWITFSFLYAFSENYMLALSHDEVVHGKSHLLGKMPGNSQEKMASLRCLYGYMFCHPGKKTLFMGMELGEWQEWQETRSLDWTLLTYEPHQKLKLYLQTLNHLLQTQPALHQKDSDPSGFRWIDCSDTSGVIAFLRYGFEAQDTLVVVCNLAPIVRPTYRIGVPDPGFYQELLNSDALEFWGSGAGNLGGKEAMSWSYHGLPYSLELCLPPTSVLILKRPIPTPN